MSEIRLFTIGSTCKTAEGFFTTLAEAGVKRVVDVRLRNTSQLAGFAKRPDLAYFLHAVSGIEYVHRPDLAPTRELLAAFKSGEMAWADYGRDYLKLLAERWDGEAIAGLFCDGDCLLCAEPTPEHCHRRLLAEYVEKNGCTVTVRHL